MSALFLAGFLGAALIASHTAAAPRDSGQPHPLRRLFTQPSGEAKQAEAASYAAGAPHGLAALAREKQALNGDTVGWLRLSGTAIDDVVLWRKGDNDYYLRRNFERRHYNNGVYYADKGCVFGDGSADALGKNTVIYGHSMSDSKNDVKFGPMRYYLEEDFARAHPYIHFSTVRENLVWEVVAVFYTDYSVPYNSNSLSPEGFEAMFEQVAARSLFTYGYDYNPDDKFLTLSTCVYSLPQTGALPYPNQYRFGIMARLVGEGEERKAEADLKRNLHIAPP